MDKDRDVKDGIRGQVMHLNPPVVKEATEEVRNRKTEAPKNMRKENNRLISPLMRKILPHRSMPMDHSPRLKKMALNQTQKMRVGAPTAASSIFPFEADLFCAIGMSLSPHARGQVVASFSWHSRARVDESCGGEERGA